MWPPHALHLRAAWLGLKKKNVLVLNKAVGSKGVDAERYCIRAACYPRALSCATLIFDFFKYFS